MIHFGGTCKCASLIHLAHKDKEQVLLDSLLPLLYQVSFLFCFCFFLMESMLLPFCFCLPLETHTEELNPNVALNFIQRKRTYSNHWETWSALTSRWPPHPLPPLTAVTPLQRRGNVCTAGPDWWRPWASISWLSPSLTVQQGSFIPHNSDSITGRKKCPLCVVTKECRNVFVGCWLCVYAGRVGGGASFTLI